MKKNLNIHVIERNSTKKGTKNYTKSLMQFYWVARAKASFELGCDNRRQSTYSAMWSRRRWIINVQKAELLPGIAAITPKFIKNWTISPHRELAPSLLNVLSTAAWTTIAKEKNKIKEPDMVCFLVFFFPFFHALSHCQCCPDIKDIVAVSWNSLGTIFFPEVAQIAQSLIASFSSP